MKSIKGLLLCLISLVLLFIPLSSAANAAEDSVYLYPCSVINEGGDSNTGFSADSPVLTFNHAKELLNNNGTIYLVGGFAAYLLENQSWDLGDKSSAKVSTLSSYTEYDMPAGITLGNMGEEWGIYSLTLSNITIQNDGIEKLGDFDSLISLQSACILNLGVNTTLENGTGHAVYISNGILNITGENIAVTGDIYISNKDSRININAELTNNINVELNTNIIPSGSIIGTVASGITDISKLVCATEGYHFELSNGNIVFLAGNAGTCQITATTDGRGVISPASVSVAQNGSQVFTITPNEGYSIKDVKVDDISVLSDLAAGEGNSKTYTFTNVTAPHTIVATFELLDKIEINLPENAERLDFGYMKARSDVVPEAKTAMVKNIGTNTVKLDAIILSGAENSRFTVIPSWETGAELAAGDSAIFTVQPVADIQQAGIYTDTITMTTAGGASASCTTEAKVCYILDAFCGEHGTLECEFGITEINGELYITRLIEYNQDTYECAFKATMTPDKGYVFDTINTITYGFDGREFPSYYLDYIGKSKPLGVVGSFFCYSYSGTKFHATFRLGQFAITASVNGEGGTITPVDATAAEEGIVTVDGLTNQAFSITPDAGYHIKAVYLNNVAVDAADYADGTYLFSEVIADHTLIAEFELNSYTIAFNSNGGTGTMDSLTGLEYGTAGKLSANTFTREGYTFAGWATEVTGAAVYNDEAEVDIATNENNATVTLYAVWTGGPQAPAPPILTATATIIGQNAVLSFTDNEAWRNAISGISVNDTALTSDKYNTTTPGAIIIDQSVFDTAGDYAIVVSATDYSAASVTQTMQAAGSKPIYTVTPVEDAVYTIGTTDDGIKTMTVNSGHSGIKYFTVNISPVTPHSGDETAVFVHLRNGAQLALNASRVDFDLVQAATAGFNVLPSDVVKSYLVDELSNAVDFNPTILQ